MELKLVQGRDFINYELLITNNVTQTFRFEKQCKNNN